MKVNDRRGKKVKVGERTVYNHFEMRIWPAGLSSLCCRRQVLRNTHANEALLEKPSLGYQGSLPKGHTNSLGTRPS
ncbi:hypothetical protein CEXT_212301 [Caerostris extrusa]|uniref:Uncharacterized protein n=1 Tax=Caerostris extrusa TaxID=172846 RepID=A0AAV4WUQ3_CAEEX|nr:hypothetical protein CEXT_212301 [Caerostris extrusa]